MMDDLDWLVDSAQFNLDQAYDILGARPGPGTDVEVIPAAKFVNHEWVLRPLTKAGRAFCTKFWINPRLETNKQLASFKKQADDWGLKFKVMVQWESINE